MALKRYIVVTEMIVDADDDQSGADLAIEKVFEMYKNSENSFGLYAILDEHFEEELESYVEDIQ